MFDNTISCTIHNLIVCNAVLKWANSVGGLSFGTRCHKLASRSKIRLKLCNWYKCVVDNIWCKSKNDKEKIKKTRNESYLKQDQKWKRQNYRNDGKKSNYCQFGSPSYIAVGGNHTFDSFKRDNYQNLKNSQNSNYEKNINGVKSVINSAQRCKFKSFNFMIFISHNHYICNEPECVLLQLYISWYLYMFLYA